MRVIKGYRQGQQGGACLVMIDEAGLSMPSLGPHEFRHSPEGFLTRREILFRNAHWFRLLPPATPPWDIALRRVFHSASAPDGVYVLKRVGERVLAYGRDSALLGECLPPSPWLSPQAQYALLRHSAYCVAFRDGSPDGPDGEMANTLWLADPGPTPDTEDRR